MIVLGAGEGGSMDKEFNLESFSLTLVQVKGNMALANKLGDVLKPQQSKL